MGYILYHNVKKSGNIHKENKAIKAEQKVLQNKIK